MPAWIGEFPRLSKFARIPTNCFLNFLLHVHTHVSWLSSPRTSRILRPCNRPRWWGAAYKGSPLRLLYCSPPSLLSSTTRLTRTLHRAGSTPSSTWATPWREWLCFHSFDAALRAARWPPAVLTLCWSWVWRRGRRGVDLRVLLHSGHHFLHLKWISNE